MQLPNGFSWAKNIALGTPEVYRLSQGAWPRFLLEESDFPDPILKFQISVPELNERFKVYGIRQDSSGLLVAFIQAVHVEIDPSEAGLPDLGWRFSIQNASQRSRKNAISLVEAIIDPPFRGYGLSKHLIQKVKEESKNQGFRLMIAPVRPTLKVQFPLESIETYLERKTSEQRLFDPWLRTHLEAGATLANVCHNSVCVKASLAKWREWTELPFSQSGSLLVPGGLAPVIVDVAADSAIYTEANVWVKYELTEGAC